MYFCKMNTKQFEYDEARRAAIEGHDPMAYLRLGIIYFYGTHTERNVPLARYFIRKAITMCNGKPETKALIRKHLQAECNKGDYGLLSVTNQYLSQLYSSYNRKKAIDDFLDDKDTFAAKVLYSQCTSSNTAEMLISQQESLLRQLYAAINPDDSFWSLINIETAMTKDEAELMYSVENFIESYQEVCDKYGLDQQDILHLVPASFTPYIIPSTLYQLRRQLFKCLLSIRHLDSLITKKYLTHLYDTDYLLDLCPKISDQYVMSPLIYYVEINYDIEAVGLTYLKLLRSYQYHNLEPLVSHINGFLNRLTKAGIQHPYHLFTKETLPAIIL